MQILLKLPNPSKVSKVSKVSKERKKKNNEVANKVWSQIPKEIRQSLLSMLSEMIGKKQNLGLRKEVANERK